MSPHLLDAVLPRPDRRASLFRHTPLLPLLVGLVSSAIASAARAPASEVAQPAEPEQHWTSYTAGDAQARKAQVEHGMLPSVVFSGETNPTSIEARLAVHKTPALSVAVIRHGKLDWTAAWGQLQAAGARAECGTLFQAGSLAKPATLLAALRMKAAGVIDLDRSIETYLSSYHLPAGRQTDANPVTFRNLLAHISGVTPGGYAGYEQNQPLPTDQQVVLGETPSNSRKIEVLNAPGASLSYSGGGYTVVEIALQDQLRQPFEQLMRAWLFAPVGMKQADFTTPLPVASHPFTARGHQSNGTVVPGGWHNHPEQAAAGLWATATDLALLLIEIQKGYEGASDVFTQASIRELLANPIENHVYGFRLVGAGDQVFITHYGGTVGYRAGMTLNVRTGDGAVFLTNSDGGSNLGAEFFSAVARVYGWSTFREEEVQRTEQPATILRSLTGLYVFPDQGWKVSVVYEKERLTLAFPNGDRLAMVPIQGGPLTFIHETGVRISFEGEREERKIHLYGQTGQRQANEARTE